MGVVDVSQMGAKGGSVTIMGRGEGSVESGKCLVLLPGEACEGGKWAWRWR